MISKIGLKNHWAVADYLQRSAIHPACLPMTSKMKTFVDVSAMLFTSSPASKVEVAMYFATKAGDPPHIILLPEVPFEKTKFITQVKQTVKEQGYCVIVASEGTQTKNGKFLADSGLTDAFGHKQLGGVAPVLAGMISKIGLKNHWAVADYLQRSAIHPACLPMTSKMKTFVDVSAMLFTSSPASKVEVAMYFATEPKPGEQSV